MYFKNIIFAFLATSTSVLGSPLTDRQENAVPVADCCGCDLTVPGYVCKVPDPSGCVVPAVVCPFEPATQIQCCCCDPSTPAIRCQAVAKDDGCFCPAVECPFEWSPSFLPISV
ncbi:hypothetical protein Cob_v007075 [Colletotrichum orbiculare MAFF 240422]|uniref:Uncharacterized protein n=1 Tax=Colletotrichum orbiculare (strain 104-T / ATCC 96160 / CBS 514.97 / LARS 414 / MAFF 240422) TaxID=1213857 RepID=N4UK84_COLOR|nr:hypothetical protein Cob_v007075 [Colletotrichum orbiculare MAFF 240422]